MRDRRTASQHEELSTSAVKYLFTDGLQLLAVADGQLHVFDPLTGKHCEPSQVHGVSPRQPSPPMARPC